MRRPGILLTMAIAWVGVVAGHMTAYLLTYPSQGVRHIHLAITGHTWLGVATASLIAVIPVILLAAVFRSIRADAAWSGSRFALLLAAIQVPSFALIEILERGWSPGEALADPAVFVGLILQPLVAVVAAWALELLRRTVRAIVSRLRLDGREAPRSFPRPASELSAPRSWLLRYAQLRAPPLPLSI